VAGLLNGLSEMMITANAAFDDGQVVRIPGGSAFKMIRAGGVARSDYTLQASVHFHHENYAVRSWYRTRRDAFPASPAVCRHTATFRSCARTDGRKTMTVRHHASSPFPKASATG
jgi:hypothetical protein